jgi:hypothetical protein
MLFATIYSVVFIKQKRIETNNSNIDGEFILVGKRVSEKPSKTKDNSNDLIIELKKVLEKRKDLKHTWINTI